MKTALGLLFGIALACFGEDPMTAGNATLGGISTICVNAHPADVLLQSESELRLRKAGIKIGPASAEPDTTCPGILVISANRQVSGKAVSIFIDVRLSQSVRLERRDINSFRGLPVTATTWSIHGHTMGGDARAVEREARANLDRMLDLFANAYLAANGK